MTVNRRFFLLGSVSAPALVLGAASARAWSSQPLGPQDGATYAARCDVLPHDGHLKQALDLLAKTGITVPLANAQACPICGCTITPT